MIYGEHPKDVERECPKCKQTRPHVFVATRIVDGDPHVREAHTVICLACVAEYECEGAEHPEYGCDELGWVCERRPPRVKDTERPPAFFGEAAAE